MTHIDVVLDLDFGQGGNAAHHLGPGWSAGEQGYRWMTGDASELWLEHPGLGRDFILELDLDPFVVEEKLPAQHLSVAIRGTEVGHVTLSSRGTLGFRVPAALVQAPGPVRITFAHPDRASPRQVAGRNDDRLLALSARTGRLLRLAPLPARVPASGSVGELVLQFERLGENCEFGLVQRRCGQEPLGLFRFSYIELQHLVRAMRNGFAGLGDPAMLRLTQDAGGNEYIVHDIRYWMEYHTFLSPHDVSPEQLLAQQPTRLQFLVRKLTEDLQDGGKILVLKRNQALTEPEILPLFATLRRFGPNRLLWIVPCDASHRPGDVEVILPGLLKGHIDRFAPSEDAHDLSFDCWLELCSKAAAAENASGQ